MEAISLNEAIASCEAVADWLTSLPEGCKLLAPDGETIVIPDPNRAGQILQMTLFTMGTA
jgi:hypothetical protein